MSSTIKKWAPAIAAPVFFALAGGLGWSLFDAFHLAGQDQVVWRAWALAAAAAVLVTIAIAPVAVALRLVWDHPDRGGRLRRAVKAAPARWAALACLGVAALALMAVATFAVQSAATLLFGSDMVRVIFTTGAVPAVAAVIFAAAWWIRPLAVGLFKKIESHRKLAAICAGLPTLLLLAGALAVPFVAPSVWEQLTPASYLAVPVIGASALVGVFIGSSKRLLVAGAVAGTATVALAAVHLATPTPDELRRSLEVRPSGTATVFSLIPRGTSGPAHAGRDGESATCFPDIEPLPADQVGEVEGDAPDIIFITADALRWDHTTLSGYPHPTTPHLEEHAEDAVVFEQAYSPASNTRQAFRGFFTGIYPSLIEAPPTPGAPWATSFSDGQQTMADYLSAAGYQTIALSSRDRAFPTQHGALNGFEVIDETPIPMELDLGYSVPYKVDRIISHLSDLEEDRPQFIWTHLMEIHQPYPAGPNPRRFDTGRYGRYNSAIHFVDGELKRLLDFARGPTRIDNTIVVLTADHGQAFGEHDNRLHGMTTYQEEIHVPLIFWGPDAQPRRLDAPVAGVDILPTLLGWLDLQVPEAMCGDDLSAAVRGEEPPPNTPVYAENIPDDTRDYFGVAFIEETEKLLLFPSQQVAELYDLREDPGELNNLGPHDPERLQRRLDALRDFYEERGMDPEFYSLDAMGPASEQR